MQSGDTIQIAQVDSLRHWIYATVLSANADGSAVVQVSHPGNLEHATIKTVKAADIRGKADLQALLQGLKPLPDETPDAFRNRQLGFLTQIDRLS